MICGEDVRLLIADERGGSGPSGAPIRVAATLHRCARDLAVLLHEVREALFIEGEAALARELARQLDREAVRRRELEGVAASDLALRGDLLEKTQAARERLVEALLLGAHDLLDVRAVLDQLGERGPHLLGDHVGQSPEVGQPDRLSLLDGAPDDAAQHVAAPLVRRHDAVADEERHPAAVVGEDAVRLRRARVSVPGDAALLLDPGHDRLVAVGLVHRPVRHVLQDRRGALEAQAGVDVLLRERRQRPVRVQLVLHEDEVPELEEAVAARAGRRAVGLAAAVLLAPVPVDLGVRPAWPGAADRPEVLAARQRDDALGRHPDRLPEAARGPVLAKAELRVAGMHRGPDARPVELQALADERRRELDRALLEVVAEREVAEHLEEGQVVAVEPDLVDVRRAEALLRRRRARRGRLLAAEEERHLRLHPGRRQQRRVVAGARDQRPRRQPLMAVLLEVREVALAQLGGRLHASDCAHLSRAIARTSSSSSPSGHHTLRHGSMPRRVMTAIDAAFSGWTMLTSRSRPSAVNAWSSAARPPSVA